MRIVVADDVQYDLGDVIHRPDLRYLRKDVGKGLRVRGAPGQPKHRREKS